MYFKHVVNIKSTTRTTFIVLWHLGDIMLYLWWCPRFFKSSSSEKVALLLFYPTFCKIWKPCQRKDPRKLETRGANVTLILFSLVDPSGKVRPEITNKNGNPNYKFFYSNADQGATVHGNEARSEKCCWCLWRDCGRSLSRFISVSPFASFQTFWISQAFSFVSFDVFCIMYFLDFFLDVTAYCFCVIMYNKAA